MAEPNSNRGGHSSNSRKNVARNDGKQQKNDAAPSPSASELKKIFQPYPRDDSGLYCQSYSPDDPEFLSVLKKYGIVVVRVLSDAECDAAVDGMFQELNQQAASHQKMPLSKDDPTTWEDENWPAPTSRFLTSTMALHQTAWNNRTHPNVYQVFQSIFNTEKLWASIDRWGIMRGTKNLAFKQPNSDQVSYEDRPTWTNTLTVHWDWNPWLQTAAEAAGDPEVFQGLIALVDCPEEVGGFFAVSGSTNYTREWVNHQKPYTQENIITRLNPHDPMNNYLSKIPIRKGDMIVWNGLTVHATFPNTSDRMRIVQYIRLMPAIPECEQRDNHAPKLVLKEDADTRRALQSVQLSELGKRLLGLEPWH